jgi:hypothetical protein
MKKKPSKYRTCAACQWSYPANGGKTKCARRIVKMADAGVAPVVDEPCAFWKERK